MDKKQRGGARKGAGKKAEFSRALNKNKTIRIAGDEYDEQVIKVMVEARNKFYKELEEKEKKWRKKKH